MALTINQGFDRLRQNLEITGLQGATVSARQQNVRAHVGTDLAVLESFLTGSYMRNTMIAPLSSADVDIFIVLDPTYYSYDGYVSILDRVRRVLVNKYTQTQRISRNGQAITIYFSDFRVDVVPAFFRNGGGYLIPDSIGKRWISTDPKQHIEIWNRANKAQNGNLVPFIKMLKHWNRTHSDLLYSFHLEALILQCFSSKSISDFPTAIREFFDTARTTIRYGYVSDPSGFGGNLGAYLDTSDKKEAVASRFETGYQKSSEAIDLAYANRLQQAFDKWHIVFGDWFPSYG